MSGRSALQVLLHRKTLGRAFLDIVSRPDGVGKEATGVKRAQNSIGRLAVYQNPFQPGHPLTRVRRTARSGLPMVKGRTGSRPARRERKTTAQAPPTSPQPTSETFVMTPLAPNDSTLEAARQAQPALQLNRAKSVSHASNGSFRSPDNRFRRGEVASARKPRPFSVSKQHVQKRPGEQDAQGSDTRRSCGRRIGIGGLVAVGWARRHSCVPRSSVRG